jgi:hypothetical protein
MLFIFRQYQKSLYAFVGTLLFFSFLLTTFVRVGDPSTNNQEKPKVIGKLFDGTPFSDVELHGVMTLIDADESHGETHPVLKSITSHLLVEDRIFQRVFQAHKENLDASLLDCHKKISRLKSYKDPIYADLSVESIYKRLMPRTVDVVEKLRKPDLTSQEYFDLVVDYTKMKGDLSSDLIRQFFSYMAAAKGLKVEPPQNVSLIQIHKNSDLFSKKFMQLVACTLLNGAKYAQNAGVSYTNDEVKAEVVAKVLKILRQQQQNTLPFHKISIRNIAHGMGLSEERFLESYKTLALFKRFLEIEKTKDLIDPLMAQKISNFANQKADLDLFKMKDEVKLNSLDELFKMQCYLEATTKVMQDRRNLQLNLEPLSIEEVKKNAPELLQVHYGINLKKISLSEVSLSIPLKKMLKWQLEDENFYAIADEFKQVQDLGAIDDVSRQIALDKLETKVRIEVDNFSRRRMALEDKELMKSAFERISFERKDVEFLLSGKTTLFSGAHHSHEVTEKLQSLEDQEIFTFDNEHFYQVQVLEKSEEPSLLLFKEALEKGQLDLLLERYLKARYPQVRIMYRDQFEKDGEWLSFDLVKGALERIVFKDLLEAIEISGGYSGKTLHAPHQFYLDNRFKNHLETVVTQFDAKSMEDLKGKLDLLENSSSAFTKQFHPHITSSLLSRAQMKNDLRVKLEGIGFKTLVGPQLFDRGEQAYLSLKEWKDSSENEIALAKLQEKVGESAKEEALDKFFEMLGKVSPDALFAQETFEG